jgi:uncharacterized protein (TIGR01777 family)
MRIAITGASGFVGSATAACLQAAGHEVVRLVRGRTSGPGTAGWDPATGDLDGAALGAADAVVHLAGENVAKRWTEATRRAITDSRVPATERLCRSLAALQPKPTVLVAASAIGFYGDRGDDSLDESSAPGTGFLAGVARAWEAATRPAAEAGIRVANLRLGMVLDPSGGALRRMLVPFRLGIGGRLGHGRQWVSWVSRADLVRAIAFVLARPELAGPVLAVAPEPVTNREFTRALAAALHRPAVVPVPAFALRLLFGRMADELLLASQRARPERLLHAGFVFDEPQLPRALQRQLAAARAHT